MRIIITLTNDFHRRSVNLRPRHQHAFHGGQPIDLYTLSRRQVARARTALCGISGCKCGGLAGERGPQFYEREPGAMPPRETMEAAAELGVSWRGVSRFALVPFGGGELEIEFA